MLSKEITFPAELLY